MDDILITADEARRRLMKVKNQTVNIDEIVDKNLRRIAEFIDVAIKTGKDDAHIILAIEDHLLDNDEIYEKITQEVEGKGYKIEIKKDSIGAMAIVSWDD